MSNVSSLVHKVKRASNSLNIDLEIIERSFFEQIEETSAESRKLEKVVSDIRESMNLLEDLVRRNTPFTPSSSIADLSTAEHMSVAAFHFAVNDGKID
jgi:hypothetical protein